MTKSNGKSTDHVITCTPMALSPAEETVAAMRAIEINPANRAPVERLAEVFAGLLPAAASFQPQPGHLAVLTTKYWGAGGVRLTVGFVEQTAADLRNRILAHLNAWSEVCNATFVWTQADPQVRISRGSGGYWSYLGTDVLSIPRNRPTMNLEGFTMRTSEAEFRRVVRHEAGHTLGFPHEHMRRELVARIDPEKAIAYFGRTQGWSASMVRQQVLTPLEESSLLGTEHSDDDSIMCYQLPGSITVDGRPIPGGNDIDAEDAAFAAKIYPKAVTPPPADRLLTTVKVYTSGRVEAVSP